MSKVNVWQVVAVAAGVLGLAIGYLWGGLGGGGTTLTAPSSSGGAPVVTGGISVTGSGTVSGTPDALKLVMGVEVNAPTVSAALDGANAAASKVQATLRAKGVAEKDLQTSGVSIQPRYSYANNTQTLTGYQVSENLTATLKNLKTAGEAITAAATAGGDATRIESVALDLTDSSALVTSARDAAFTQAKAKAGQYAKAAGSDLGKVISIQESVSGDQPVPVAKAEARDATTMSSVPIAPGSQDVVVTVTAVFALD
ncbi:MAG: uncharacterized protein QG622_2478 [Actinomycetota bacterium]|nr:uncharacterized protein [Actinomycetota bacterium]